MDTPNHPTDNIVKLREKTAHADKAPHQKPAFAHPAHQTRKNAGKRGLARNSRQDIIESFDQLNENDQEDLVSFSEFNTSPPFKKVPRSARRKGDSSERAQVAMEDAIAGNPELLLALPLSRENAFRLLMRVEHNEEILNSVHSGLALGTLNADSVKGMIVDRILSSRRQTHQ